MVTEPPAPAADPAADDAADPVRRLVHALVCAAAEPALSGVLLLDLEPGLLDPVPRLFTGLLTGTAEPAWTGAAADPARTTAADPAPTGTADPARTTPADPAPPPVVVGAAGRDEDLWTRTRLRRDTHGITFRTEPGPLVDADGRPGPPPLVVVPHLPPPRVAGMRAAV
ncbi:hypothetical protein J7I94_28510, partial [Streptomyces sp. ISL-12]|nr:hypothetical protein [Streptomyces sp. ISL-12]